MIKKTLIAALLTFLPILSSAGTVSELQAQGDGIYTMKIDGKKYKALSEEIDNQVQLALAEHAKLKEKLTEATKKLEKYEQLTNQYDELRGKYVVLTGDYKRLSEDSLQLNGKYSEAAGNLIALNKDYGNLVKEYDALTEKYRQIAVRSHPREALDFGLGVQNRDDKNKGVAMVGAGTRVFNQSLRGWLFGGEKNYGLVLGLSF